MDTRKTQRVIGAAGLALLCITSAGSAALPPGVTPGVNYQVGNYANSPILTKFVNGLPGVGLPGGAGVSNNLGQYIPMALPMGTLTPTSVPRDGDYFSIAAVQYQMQMHSNLGPTTLRGYVQIEPPGSASIPPGSQHLALPGITYGGNQVYAYATPQYMGPLINATSGVPTRVKCSIMNMRWVSPGWEYMLG